MTERISGMTPGEMLKEDFLHDIDVHTLAAAIEITTPELQNIIDGKAPITPDISRSLGIFFGMSEDFWLNIQKDYEQRTKRL